MRAYSHEAWAQGFSRSAREPRSRPRALVALRRLQMRIALSQRRWRRPGRGLRAGRARGRSRRRRPATRRTNDHRTLHARPEHQRLQPAGLPPRAGGAADGSRRVYRLRQPDPPAPSSRRPRRRRHGLGGGGGGAPRPPTAAVAGRSARALDKAQQDRRRPAAASAASSCTPGVVHANIASAFSSLPDAAAGDARLPARLRGCARRPRDRKGRACPPRRLSLARLRPRPRLRRRPRRARAAPAGGRLQRRPRGARRAAAARRERWLARADAWLPALLIAAVLCFVAFVAGGGLNLRRHDDRRDRADARLRG